MAVSTDIDALNKEFYLNQTAAAWYNEKQFVLPEEQSFLAEFSDELCGKTMLDIGIGAGRTTRFLLPMIGDYIGVDYSPEMVKKAVLHFPSARLEVRDARDLSVYADGQFDFVLFSFNGLDCLSHKGRLQSLAEIRRVLKPGGLFAFSSHNRGRSSVKPYSLRYLNRSKHPVRMLRNVARYFAGIWDWHRSFHHAEEQDDYALRHDSANFFTVPMYYIEKQAQVRQLASAGFNALAIYDGKGNVAQASEPDAVSSWIFYVCRRVS